MAEKKLRSLKREDLLEMLLEQSKENERLKAENEKLKKQLQDRLIKTEQAGNIAEAALRLNEVFEAAQNAADQYLASVRAMCEDIPTE